MSRATTTLSLISKFSVSASTAHATATPEISVRVVTARVATPEKRIHPGDYAEDESVREPRASRGGYVGEVGDGKVAGTYSGHVAFDCMR